MLSIGSYYDLKSREIDDRLWMVFGAAGLILYAWEYMSGATADVQMVLISVSLTAAIAIVLYRYGFFGGADVKALLTISVILPLYYPSSYNFYVHPMTGIMVLTNAVIFAMVVPLYNALSNLLKVARGERIFAGFEKEPKWRKVMACFVGTSSNKQILEHHSVIEHSVDEGVRKFSFRLNHDNEECGGSDDRSSYPRVPTDDPIWLSQNLPFLVFILAGFLATVLFGDILLQILHLNELIEGDAP